MHTLHIITHQNHTPTTRGTCHIWLAGKGSHTVGRLERGAHWPPRVYVTLRPHRDVRHIPDSANRHHFQGLTDENGYRHHLFWTSQAPCHYGQPNHGNALLRVSRLDIAQRAPCCCAHFFSSSLMYSGPLSQRITAGLPRQAITCSSARFTQPAGADSQTQ